VTGTALLVMIVCIPGIIAAVELVGRYWS